MLCKYFSLVSTPALTTIITPKYSAVLQFTSILFQVPAMYAFRNNLHFYGIFSVFTSIISFVYWLYPINGWRRNIDSVYAKLTFLLYTSSGIIFVPLGFLSFVFYLLVGLLVYFYILSCSYFPQNNWIYFHTLFHLTAIYLKFYVLYYMKEIYDIDYCYSNTQSSIYSLNYC